MDSIAITRRRKLPDNENKMLCARNVHFYVLAGCQCCTKEGAMPCDKEEEEEEEEEDGEEEVEEEEEEDKEEEEERGSRQG